MYHSKMQSIKKYFAFDSTWTRETFIIKKCENGGKYTGKLMEICFWFSLEMEQMSKLLKTIVLMRWE